MTINGSKLLELAPIKNMLSEKIKHNGVSHGLTEAGYDIRIKQDIRFETNVWGEMPVDSLFTRDVLMDNVSVDGVVTENTRFTLASAIEEFDMPTTLVGKVHDKSTWVRKGLSVFNTVIEPNWKGFLTLELVYYGKENLHIPAGSGIAQILFSPLAEPAEYNGKYQNQEDKPVEAIMRG